MQAGVRTHSSRFAEPSFPLYVSMTRWDICAHSRVGEVNARRLTQVASIGASEMRSCGAQIRTLPVWHQSVYVALTSIAALATALYVTPATMVWSRHRQMMRPTSRANPSVALGLRMVDRAGGMSWTESVCCGALGSENDVGGARNLERSGVCADHSRRYMSLLNRISCWVAATQRSIRRARGIA